MKKLWYLWLITVVLIVSVLSTGITFGKGNPAPQSKVAVKATFQDDMRKLWEDHIIWTRQVIVDIFASPSGLPDLSLAVDRLLQNQADIGNAIKPLYGDAAGNQLTALLRTHITTAAEILTALKAGNTAALDDASARWYANADDISVFLNSANPKNWPLGDTKAMMKHHLDLTAAEALARFEGRWADDIAAFDEVHRQILMMADFLSSGIMAQFPQKFTKGFEMN